MKTFFISDLHLQAEEPKVINGFLYFLQGKAKFADALYILGDLFESWIGDDDPTLLHRKVASATNALVCSGVPCYLIRGNRDFLISNRFARESGIVLLPEEKVLDIYGRKVLIMHGDTLCTDDICYQSFRSRVHTPWIQKIFLSLPLFIRSRIVARVRMNSKSSQNNKLRCDIDVNPYAVAQVFKKYNVQWLIHGHTHRLNLHNFIVNGAPVCRVVLGAWYKKGSAVKITPESVELISFPL